MGQATDVAIIGGGVIGCAIAYYLRKYGRDVMLLERGEIGSQASGAAAGLLAPLGPLTGQGTFADLLLAGFAHLTALVPELEEASGISPGYEQTGALRIVRNPKRIAHLRKRMEAWQPLGLQMYWLTGEEACRREPLLSPATCAAIYIPEEAQINAARVVQAFAEAASRLGAHICRATEVTGVCIARGRVTGVRLANGDTLACNSLVIASGAWSALYGNWLQLALPVSPLRGQMLAYAQSMPPLRHIIFGEAAYLAPKGERIVVGATKEETGFITQVTDEGISWLRTTAERLVPSLEQHAIKATWAGLRPKTPDMRPILGPAPGYENVTLAVGHNSVGVILSAITGQTIAECVTTGHVSPLIRPFLLDRFTETMAGR